MLDVSVAVLFILEDASGFGQPGQRVLDFLLGIRGQVFFQLLGTCRALEQVVQTGIQLVHAKSLLLRIKAEVPYVYYNTARIK